jgi:hypothetical protein
MPTKVIQLIRHAPIDLLKEYFSFLPATAKIDWNSSNKQILQPLLQIIDELKANDKHIIVNEIERILTMTDKSGQDILDSVISNRKVFYAMQNIYQKSLWAFLYDYESFENAEEIRHADIYLKDSSWDGFIGPLNINILQNLEQLATFEEKLKKLFNIDDPIKIDIINRYLSDNYLDDSRSFQIIVHYEGSSVTYKKFIEDDIIHATINPIEELVITYEPNNGKINIISKGKKCKTAIAKAFAKTLLSSSQSQEQVSLMSYNLNNLLKPYDFITLPEDGIQSVKVLQLVLQTPHNSAKFAIEVSKTQKSSIYMEGEKIFKDNNLLKGDCGLISATLYIRFKPDKANRSGKKLLITVSLPNTCVLESNSLEEHMIVNKYFKIWKITKEI